METARQQIMSDGDCLSTMLCQMGTACIQCCVRWALFDYKLCHLGIVWLDNTVCQIKNSWLHSVLYIEYLTTQCVGKRMLDNTELESLIDSLALQRVQ